MIGSPEGSPARPGLGHQSAPGQSELSGYVMSQRSRESGRVNTINVFIVQAQLTRTSQARLKGHVPEGTSGPPTRMQSNNGAHPQWVPRLSMRRSAQPSSHACSDHITDRCPTFFTVWTCWHPWGERGAIGNSSHSSLLRQTPTRQRQDSLMVFGSCSNLEEDRFPGLGQCCRCSRLHKESVCSLGV